MKRLRQDSLSILPLITIFLWATMPESTAETDNGHWPSFRGAGASGVADGHATPIEWNAETSQNIRWKAPIPGLGHSSPVIWGNRIFVTTAISGQEKPELKVGLYGSITPVEDDTTHRWQIFCLDKSGEILWQKTVHQGTPRSKRHPKSTQANSTPATDGEHIVAFFGSEGLYCYNFAGELLWQKDLGVLESSFFQVPTAQWGFASSPIIDDGKVFLQIDVLKNSYIAAFEIENGTEIWKTPRQDVPSWSTPSISSVNESKQLIVNGFKHIGGYDIDNGEAVWQMKGGGDIPIPTPVIANDLIFITNAHGGLSPIYAIRNSAKGDITLAAGSDSNQAIAWSKNREGAYMPTPVVYQDLLYICRDNGALSVYRAKTGERLYQQRLGTAAFTASTVAADGKVYFTSEEGDIYVVKAGPKFELLSINSMAEICMATPAISEGILYFRTQSHIVAVGQ